MADIKNQVALCDESLKIIDEIKKTVGFSFKSWGDNILLPVRVEIRNFYRQEQVGQCAYCKNPISRSALGCHVEHIVPKSLYQQFMFHPKNLCAICPDCNEIKRERDIANPTDSTLKKEPKLYPRSSNAFIIYHPHFDDYDEHIAHIDGYYFDKTDKGANTIRMCVLNRKLRDFGYHKSIIATPGQLDLIMRIFQSGKLDRIMEIIEEDKKT
ncbi:hypothetical protein C9426_28515 [Serratia sp. S1B]|nr:hypothetical protein C9426_28515 [Serratia sp. S1B]